METAKIFETGRSQAVRLPKRYRFDTNEVYIQKLGEAVLLVPKEVSWQSFLEGLHGFGDDFLPNGRELEIPSTREEL